MVPTDNTQKISRLDASGLNDLEGLKKEKKRIKGDWGWPTTNPLVMKLGDWGCPLTMMEVILFGLVFHNRH